MGSDDSNKDDSIELRNPIVVETKIHGIDLFASVYFISLRFIINETRSTLPGAPPFFMLVLN